MLSDRQPKLSTRGQKTKIDAVLDKNTVYSPTDNQSYQRADRRQKYMQFKTKTLYILRQTTKVTNTRTGDKNTQRFQEKQRMDNIEEDYGVWKLVSLSVFQSSFLLFPLM